MQYKLRDMCHISPCPHNVGAYLILDMKEQQITKLI